MTELETWIVDNAPVEVTIREDMNRHILSSEVWTHLSFKTGVYSASKLVWDYLVVREGQLFTLFGGVDKTMQSTVSSGVHTTAALLERQGIADYVHTGDWTVFQTEAYWAFAVRAGQSYTEHLFRYHVNEASVMEFFFMRDVKFRRGIH